VNESSPIVHSVVRTPWLVCAFPVSVAVLLFVLRVIKNVFSTRLRSISAVKLSNENIGSFAFYGRNSASTPETLVYSRIMANMTDVTDGSENSDIFFQQIHNGTIQETVRVLSSGNVGIGTNAPTRDLHVNGGALNFVALFESTDTKGGILLADNGTSADGVYWNYRS